MTEFLQQWYKVTTLNCECLRRMEHEASRAVPTNVREDLVATITGTECNLAVLRGAPGMESNLFGILQNVLARHDMMIPYNQTLQKARKTRGMKTSLVVCLPKKESLVERGNYDEALSSTHILTNSMRETLPTVMRPSQYCGVPGRSIFDAISFIRDALA